MPIVKTKRADILRKKEIENLATKTKPVITCIIGLLWAFGKRISEVLALRKEDVYLTNGYLHVKFKVLKKRKKDSVYLKRINEKHPAVRLIMAYVETASEGDLFPAMTRQLVWYYLKKASKQVYPHLFRKSLATEMSERSFTVQQLMSWFDWTEPKIAMEYVARGPGLTKELSERIW